MDKSGCLRRDTNFKAQRLLLLLLQYLHTILSIAAHMMPSGGRNAAGDYPVPFDNMQFSGSDFSSTSHFSTELRTTNLSLDDIVNPCGQVGYHSNQ
jgi:hypothetical protein